MTVKAILDSKPVNIADFSALQFFRKELFSLLILIKYQ